MADTVYIPDLISDVVDAIKDTAAIISITDNADNTYTVNTLDTKDIAENDFITISETTNFNGSYQISNLVADTSFDISLTSGYATETGTWTADNPYYLYGHITDVLSVIQEKDLVQARKYPLIWLSGDIKEKMPGNEDEAAFFSIADIRIVLINITDNANHAKYRFDNNFKTVLIPLYEKFIAKMKDIMYFSSYPDNILEHERNTRFDWANQADSAISNDRVDGLELLFRNLKVLNQYSC